MGKLKLAIIFVVILAVVSISAVALSTAPTQDELLNRSLSDEKVKMRALENPSVQELINNNEQYKGKVVHLQGTIAEILAQKEGMYIISVLVDNQEMGGEDKVVLRYASETEPRILSNIDFYGTVVGPPPIPSITGSDFVGVDALIVKVI